ncbi:MAG: amino acid-binding protein [Verrucomicrobiota bacterium]
MKIKQLCVFLENQKGHLAHIAEVVSGADATILALSLADTAEFGILRLILDKPEKAAAALREHHMTCRINEVTAVEMGDGHARLTEVLHLLDGNNINIEYMYALSERRPVGAAAFIFRFDKPEEAIECLQQGGVNVLEHVDLGLEQS